MHHLPLSTILLASLTACAGAPDPGPLVPPTLETGVRYFSGTVLSGRRPDVDAADRLSAADAYEVQCDVTYVERMPWDALDAASMHTRLIVAARAADPLLPAAELGIGARVGSGDAAEQFLAELPDGGLVGRSVPVFEFRAASCESVTTGFFAQSIDAVISDEGEPIRKLTSLLVGREPGGTTATVAMLFEDVAPEYRSFAADFDSAVEAPVIKRQLILLEDELTVGGPPIVVVIPLQFLESPVPAFVVRVEMRAVEPDNPMLSDALAHCADDLRREGLRATTDSAWFGEVEQRSRAVARGLRALDMARNHRPILVFLAGQGNAAPLALDLALSGDEATLATWAQLVDSESQDAASQSDVPEDVAWLLERTAFELLGTRLDRDELSTELRGMLSRHAGEAGRFPGTITGMLSRAADHAAFEAKIVAENIGFLEAPDPSSRVRAVDWLANRGLAPVGYDPLGSRDEREAALDAYRAAREAAARPEPGPPGPTDAGTKPTQTSPQGGDR